MPTINSNVGLHVVVCGIFPRIADNNSMRMRSAVCRIVCFIKAVTNIYAVFAPTNIKCVVIAATIRTRAKSMIVATCNIYICSVLMSRQFSDRGLGSTKPAIYGNKWLHVIMTYIIACIVNGYGMCVTAWFKRIVSICSIAITTTRHASVTFIRPAKLKWVHMSTSCTNTCIMCMRWKFSDRK